MVTSLQQEKAQLRLHFKRLRQKLCEDQIAVRACEASIASRLEALVTQDSFCRLPILLYAALDTEIDVLGLRKLVPNRVFGLPKVSGRTMQFYSWKNDAELTPGLFGIREPMSATAKVDLSKGAIIICPGLSFTADGMRLGYGGGYYDRFIGDHNHIFLYIIGVSFTSLISQRLPCEETDKKMNAVVTETDCYFT